MNLESLWSFETKTPYTKVYGALKKNQNIYYSYSQTGYNLL